MVDPLIHYCDDCGSKAFTVRAKNYAIIRLTCRECGKHYSVGIRPRRHD